jgi:hypothetical protein
MLVWFYPASIPMRRCHRGGTCGVRTHCGGSEPARRDCHAGDDGSRHGPGLPDSHAWIDQRPFPFLQHGGARYRNALPLETWALYTVAYGRALGDEAFRLTVLLTAAEMLRSGVTSAVDHFAYAAKAEVALAAHGESGMRVALATRHPNLSLSVMALGPADVTDELRSGRIDIAISFVGRRHPDIEVVAESPAPVGAVVIVSQGVV